MDEVLNAHPDVAQNLVKLLSDALTEARRKVKELELGLSEKNALFTEISGNAESELILKTQGLAELQVLYAAEKESGLELLLALEERVLDINSREADTLLSERVAKERAIRVLHEKYDTEMGEKIALQKLLSLWKPPASDLAAQEAALSQVSKEKFLFAQKLLKAQADAQTTESLRSEAAQELERQRAQKQELEIALQESKSQLVSQTTLFTQVVADNDLRFRALQMKLQHVESVAATGEQGHAKVVLEVARCRANLMRLEEEISALEDIRDAAKAQILALEDALKTRDVELEELRNKNEQAKLAAMDAANTSGADKAQMIALEDVLKARDELVELREQVKCNAMDLTTKLLSAGESHRAQIGKLKDILRATDVELMDLQNKNEQIKSTVKRLQNKLLAAETSRHKQAEAATRSTELTRQLNEDLQREKSARVALLDQLAPQREEYRRLSQDYDILDVQAQERETTNENLRRINHTLKESALRAEIQDEEREGTIENLQRTNKNQMGSVLQAGAQVQDPRTRSGERQRKKLSSTLRANAMLQTAYVSLHKTHHQLVKERGAGALVPSVNQAGAPALTFPQAQSAAGQFESRPDRQYEQCVGAYPSQPSAQSESGANDRMSLDADHAPGLSDRALCYKFMTRLPSPNRPIRFDALKPIHVVPSSKPFDVLSHDLKTERQAVHFPKRCVFPHPDCIHALVFAPTHEYWQPADKWDTFSHTGKFCGLTFDLFMTRGAYVYYAGIYTMLRLTGEAPGFDIPGDVPHAAIHHAARLGNRKMPDCFPDGKMVKCYGLQFLGFDMGVYEQLRLRYLASTNQGTKRKASTVDLRAGGGSAKTQKT
ncbi:hypothetical protein C8J57DRAFT_1580501 [Mycena rebaudengoi]|nr:hypothetical protein C8J57DRAFT_1580501 [Mycena rebaudengoi]